jgi:hypothetical protein
MPNSKAAPTPSIEDWASQIWLYAIEHGPGW